MGVSEGKTTKGAGMLTGQAGESQTATGGTMGSGKTLGERAMGVRERAWGVGTGKAGESWPALDGGVGWSTGFLHVRGMSVPATGEGLQTSCAHVSRC